MSVKQYPSQVAPYSGLSVANQISARARFVGAGEKDGYLYELDVDGKILSRRKDYAKSRGRRT